MYDFPAGSFIKRTNSNLPTFYIWFSASYCLVKLPEPLTVHYRSPQVNVPK